MIAEAYDMFLMIDNTCMCDAMSNILMLNQQIAFIASSVWS